MDTKQFQLLEHFLSGVFKLEKLKQSCPPLMLRNQQKKCTVRSHRSLPVSPNSFRSGLVNSSMREGGAWGRGVGKGMGEGRGEGHGGGKGVLLFGGWNFCFLFCFALYL